MERKKVVGLVAHDGRKLKMVEWANHNREVLKKFDLVGTQGTAKKVRQVAKLKVRDVEHGPDGGDLRVANKILDGEVDALLFFVDTRTPHGHDHEIQVLIRTCVIKNISLALNTATADDVLQGLLKD